MPACSLSPVAQVETVEAAHARRRVVGGAVVDHHDLEGHARVEAGEGLQRHAEVVRAVEGRDDDGEAERHGERS